MFIVPMITIAFCLVAQPPQNSADATASFSGSVTGATLNSVLPTPPSYADPYGASSWSFSQGPSVTVHRNGTGVTDKSTTINVTITFGYGPPPETSTISFNMIASGSKSGTGKAISGVFALNKGVSSNTNVGSPYNIPSGNQVYDFSFGSGN
jgi:hypothetical protein